METVILSDLTEEVPTTIAGRPNDDYFGTGDKSTGWVVLDMAIPDDSVALAIKTNIQQQVSLFGKVCICDNDICLQKIPRKRPLGDVLISKRRVLIVPLLF